MLSWIGQAKIDDDRPHKKKKSSRNANDGGRPAPIQILVPAERGSTVLIVNLDRTKAIKLPLFVGHLAVTAPVAFLLLKINWRGRGRPDQTRPDQTRPKP